jgi:hypothetical protein
MADRPGIKTELRERAVHLNSGPAGHDAAAPPVQLRLDGGEDVPPAVPALTGEGGRKGGRPPGSKNLRAGKLAAFILETEGDPLVDLTRFARRDVGDLVRELQAVSKATGIKVLGKNQSLLDIVKEQRAAAEAVLPYLHQRMPLLVEMDKTSRPVLIVGTPTADQVAVAASTLGLDLRQALKPASASAPEIETEYQDLSEDMAAPSPSGASPDMAQVIDNARESDGQADDH